MRNTHLGKGLSDLLREEIAPVSLKEGSNLVAIDDIVPNEEQPRSEFDYEKILELSHSIASNGLIQPIVVSRKADNKYQIIAGERRYRACKLAGFDSIPVIVKEVNAQEALTIALIENIQREGLTAIEEAYAYQRLIAFGCSQTEIATSVGKSRSHVANMLRLNNLPDGVKSLVNKGSLSMGHARCLVGVDDAVDLAEKIVQQDLSVRQVELLVSNRKEKVKITDTGHRKDAQKPNDDHLLIADSLSQIYSLKVALESGWNGGKLSFYYNNLKELDELLSKLVK